MSLLDNKPLVRGKLSPAAEGDPPRGSNFRSKSVVLFAEVIYKKRAPEKVAQRVFREEGEKALSWQSPGGALTTFELGNGTWSVPFPDRARSLPRENASTGAKPRAKRAACEICSAATKRRGTLLGSVIFNSRKSFCWRKNLSARFKCKYAQIECAGAGKPCSRK